MPVIACVRCGTHVTRDACNPYRVICLSCPSCGGDTFRIVEAGS